jgi:peptidoglycan/xylan/chitin deacetylase (PgdA/CDA1 family)
MAEIVRWFDKAHRDGYNRDMQTSVPTPNGSAPASSRMRRLTRFLPATKRGRLLAAFAVLVLILAGSWYTLYWGAGWRQYFNPMYWVRRQRGDDLYDTKEALLLHGNHDLPEVALTFDDGPHSESRAQILDTLRRYHVHATFFDVGANMALQPDLLRRTLAEGHEIANHSYNHNRLDSLTPQERHREINDTDITYCALTGNHLHLLRPPGMRYNPAVLSDIHRLGYIVVGYSTASQDFNDKEEADVIAERTLRRTENGSIILLHDYTPTAQALPRILETLQTRGFRCVTISEMIAHLPERQRKPAQQVLSTE